MDHEILLLKVPEAAILLNVSRAKAYELVAAGVIPSVVLGGCRRVPIERLRQFIAEQTKGAAESAA